MSTNKKTLEITGHPIYPIVVGAPALIHEKDGLRKTSTVMRLDRESGTEMQFETVNTCYRLYLVAEPYSKREVAGYEQ